MANQVDTKDKFVEQVQKEMKRIREDPVKRHGFMKYGLDLMDAKAEGEKAGAIKAITMLKRLGLEREKIITELTKTYDMSNDEALELVQEAK